MILLIDNYDSFVYNVAQYLQELTVEEVKTVRNDQITLADIRKMNPSHIVLSPGPKHPKNSKVCLEILQQIDNIPILGICLGHQALGLVNGATVARLSEPLHGKTSEITVRGNALSLTLREQTWVARYPQSYCPLYRWGNYGDGTPLETHLQHTVSPRIVLYTIRQKYHQKLLGRHTTR